MANREDMKRGKPVTTNTGKIFLLEKSHKEFILLLNKSFSNSPGKVKLKQQKLCDI